MPDSKSLIAAENLPTVAATSLVLALLSVAFGYFVHREVLQLAGETGVYDVQAASRDAATKKEISALAERVSKLEAAAAAPVEVAADAAVAPPAAAPQ